VLPAKRIFSNAFGRALIAIFCRARNRVGLRLHFGAQLKTELVDP
jgi:hypothetical protein